MKVLFKKSYVTPPVLEDDFTVINLRSEMEKTRQALDSAYAGFDYAVDPDMIDCYIYEINALHKRYKHLSELYALQTSAVAASNEHPSVAVLTGHVFG